MNDKPMTTRCVCGWTTTGPEDAVVAATIEHGQRIHNMTATRDQILAMAVRPGAEVKPDPTDQGSAA